MDHLSDQAVPALPFQISPFIIGKGWVCTFTAGNLVQSKGTALPTEMRVFAVNLCERLNAEIHLDGTWSVGWTDFSVEDGFPKRLLMGYLDKDGDLIFLVDAEDPFMIMIACVDSYIDQCAQAYRQAYEHAADVGVKPDQRIKAALGQESKDPLAEGDWMTDAI